MVSFLILPVHAFISIDAFASMLCRIFVWVSEFVCFVGITDCLFDVLFFVSVDTDCLFDVLFLIVLWVMAIISASYSVVVLMEDAVEKMYPTVDSTIAYGTGFYLIACTGKLFIEIFRFLVTVTGKTTTNFF